MKICCCFRRRRRSRNRDIHPVLIDYEDGGYAVRRLKDKNLSRKIITI